MSACQWVVCFSQREQRVPLEHPELLRVPWGSPPWRGKPGSGAASGEERPPCCCRRESRRGAGSGSPGGVLEPHGRRISYAREGKTVLVLRLLFQKPLWRKSEALGSTEKVEKATF